MLSLTDKTGMAPVREIRISACTTVFISGLIVMSNPVYHSAVGYKQLATGSWL
jgi:hypothetical protein